MERYTLQIGPGEPDMVRCEGGEWVRWEEVREHVERIDALTARWSKLDARLRFLNHLQQWSALFFSAVFGATFLAQGMPGQAAACAVWFGVAALWARGAGPMPEKK